MRRTTRAATRLALLLVLGLPGPAAGGPLSPTRSVPVDGPVDVDRLLQLARISQALNARTYLQYSFRQTSRVEELDGEGAVKRRETKVHRVIPSRDGTVRQLLESDGEAPSVRELRKQETRNEKLRKRWEKIREKQRRESELRRREQQRAMKQSGPTPAVGGTRAPATVGPAESAPSAPSDPGAAGGRRPGEASEDPELETEETTNPPQTPTEPATGPIASSASGPSAYGSGASERSARGPNANGPSPIPDCDLRDPLASLRPPLTGSRTSASKAALQASSESSRRLRKTAGDYTIFELLSLTSYEYEGACRYGGRVVHVIAFTPDESFDPQNPVERVVTAMEGTLFVDADDVQIMRTEARTVAPIKWGAGMVALREAHVVFEATKVNDEVWLPAADSFEIDSRVLFSKDRQRVTHYYDDYKKLAVTSDEVFEGVVDAGEAND